MISECKTCKHYKKKHCKINGFIVTINASWCNTYNKSLKTRLNEFIFNNRKESSQIIRLHESENN